MIVKSDYLRPSILVNGHFETIYPALFRKVKGMKPERERIATPDDDFLDLDWYRYDNQKLVIICHGLEGNSRKAYMLGMAKALTSSIETDVLAWNYRGCSGEMNRANRFYHSGATEDLKLIIQHALKSDYTSIALVGFSLGGNLTLKYLGENGTQINPLIKASVTFSVPLDLEGSSLKMKRWNNYLYTQRFLRSLKKKVKKKTSLESENLALHELNGIKDLFHFDDLFTGPLHGFKDAHDYYRSCSSLFYLKSIAVPSLIVNARNDPFLSSSCFPTEDLHDHEFVHFEAPDHGGHCGFSDFNGEMYWSEKRAVNFIKSYL